MLVLGAGASFGARAELKEHALVPPIGDALATYILKWLRANHPNRFQRGAWLRAHDPRDARHPGTGLWDMSTYREVTSLLRRVARRSRGALSFEAEVESLIGSKRIGVLADSNLAIALSMLTGQLSAFRQRADRFDRLLAMHGHRVAAIITLNYDLLIEQAVQRFGVPFTIPAPNGGGLKLRQCLSFTDQ